MSESLLQPAAEAADEAIAEATTGLVPGRPAEVPAKFWDTSANALRADALLKSYLELERRLSQRMAPPAPDAPAEDLARFRDAMGIPEAPQGYAIVPPCPECGADDAVNARLHDANFSQDQAQLVYDLAAERLLPLLAEAAAHYEADRQRERLIGHFGGEDRFREVAAQLAAWGRGNLPPPVYDALSTTFEGVLAIEQMMRKGEPALGRDAAAHQPADEAALRQMMRDPRYWRTREPAFVQRVTDGFRRLMGGEG